MSEAVYRELGSRIGMHIIYVDLDGSDEGVAALVHLGKVLETQFAKTDPTFDVAAWRRRTTPSCVDLRRTMARLKKKEEA